MRRPLLLLVEVAGAALAAIALLIVAAGIRLAAAPLEIDFLAPQIVAWAAPHVAPWQLHLGGARLRWRPGRSTIDLTLTGVAITDAQGTDIMRIAQSEASLGLSALVFGRLEPSRLVLLAPALRLLRDPGGEMRFEAGETGKAASLPQTLPIYSGAGAAPGAADLPALPMRGLLAVAGAFPALHEIAVERAQLHVDDQERTIPWDIALSDLRLTRTKKNWRFGASFAGGPGATRANIAVSAALDLPSRHLVFVVTAEDFLPSAWIPALASLQIPLGARFAGSADMAGGAVGPLVLRVTGREGRISDPHFPNGGLDAAKLDAALRFDPAQHRLALDAISLTLDGVPATATGSLDGVYEDRHAPLLAGRLPWRLDLSIPSVAIAQLPALWPAGVAAGARRWIAANMTAGTVEAAVLHLGGTLAAGNSEPLECDRATGTMALRAATIDYLHGVTPVHGVEATARFDLRQFAFEIAHGEIGDLVLDRGHVAIDGLDRPDQSLALDFHLQGPAQQLVGLLASDRLHLAQRAGLNGSGVAGSVDGTLQFAFPLIKELSLAQLQYGGQARFTDLTLPRVVHGFDLTQGALDATLTHDALTSAGQAVLGGVPAQLVWKQRLGGAQPNAAMGHLVARLDQASRRRFALDFFDSYLTGPVGVVADYTEAGAGRSAFDLALDLKPAGLDLPLLKWRKPPDTQAEARLHIGFRNGKIAEISDLRFKAPDLTVAGGIDFAADESLKSAAIDRFVLRDTALAGTVARAGTGAAGQGWSVALEGASLDLAPFLKDFREKPDAASKPSGPPVAVALQVARLTLGAGRTLTGVDAKASIDQGALQSLALHGDLGPKKPLSLQLDTPEHGGKVSLRSNDFGGVLRLAGIGADIRDGTIAIDGSNSRIGGHRVFQTHLTAEHYRVLNAPVMARVAALASFTTIGSLLSGKGIPFDSLIAEARLDEGKLDLDARTHGGSLGLTAKGTVDLDRSRLDLSGQIVPAYLLNASLNAIPLLGHVLTGGSGQGLFAVNYRVYGPFDRLAVSVNPLSVLAPGFFRKLFLFGAPGPAADSSAAPGAALPPATPGSAKVIEPGLSAPGK